MKLIIDIPDNEYKYTCERTLSDRTFWDDAIRKGVPLDDVKAEIDEQYDRIRPYNIDVAQGLEMALDILDNIGKAESEEE